MPGDVFDVPGIDQNHFEALVRNLKKVLCNAWCIPRILCNGNIKNLGKIVRIWVGNGWLTVDPYLNYKPKQKAVHREVLTKEELQRIYKKKFGVERLNVVRDIFVFCCYTGLAYVDVHKLKRSELVKGIDGNLWIYTHRQKTDSPRCNK